jgi:hypothetical protein
MWNAIDFFKKYEPIWILSGLLYLVMVFEIDFEMKNKEHLKKIKKIWNLIFAIYSLIGFIKLFKYSLYLYNSYGLISIINHNYKIYDYRNNLEAYVWCRGFIVSKLFELFDTVLNKIIW